MTGRQLTLPGPPQRIRLDRHKGWRLPDGAKSVARPTVWGNPFVIGKPVLQRIPDTDRFQLPQRLTTRTGLVTDAQHAVKLYVAWLPLAVHYTIEDIRRELAGRDLACWCLPGTPCHGDILLTLAAGRSLTTADGTVIG